MKRISTEAYQALRNALPVITWNKRPFETLLRTALRDHSELLAGLNFGDTKREVTDMLVDRLVTSENKYQEVTLQLMLEVASMTSFPNIEQLKDPKDKALRLEEAKSAVNQLKVVTNKYGADIAEVEKQQAARKARSAQAEATRKFHSDIEDLKNRFIDLQKETDVHARGYAFESLLADLFLIYDLEPRLAYSIELEQIDGSFTFDTDDYIAEARWRKGQAERPDGDLFKTKVQTKGKNAMGLFVSVAGFTKTFLKRYDESTPFITMDGMDLYAVLESRIRLDDLLRAKKRHANETGSCYLPYSKLIS